jgi:hypothetical protein
MGLEREVQLERDSLIQEDVSSAKIVAWKQGGMC